MTPKPTPTPSATPHSVQHVVMVTFSTTTNFFAFGKPNNGTVHAGDTIVWQDVSGVDHAIAWDTPGSPTDAPAIPADSTSTPVTMTMTGTFHYHCAIHGTLQAGTIVVG